MKTKFKYLAILLIFTLSLFMADLGSSQVNINPNGDVDPFNNNKEDKTIDTCCEAVAYYIKTMEKLNSIPRNQKRIWNELAWSIAINRLQPLCGMAKPTKQNREEWAEELERLFFEECKIPYSTPAPNTESPFRLP